MKKVGIVICLCILMGGFLCLREQSGKIVFAAAAINEQNDVSISKEERVMILVTRAFVNAITDKDLVKMKRLNLNLQQSSPQELDKMMLGLESVHSYKLHGIEDVRIEGNVLKGIALYSMDIQKKGHIGKTVVPCMTEVEIAVINDQPVIVRWRQIKSENDLAYFQEVFSKFEKAKQKYGVEDLNDWDVFEGYDSAA